MPCLRSRAYEMAPTPHVQTYVVATDQVGLKVLRDKVGPHSQHAKTHLRRDNAIWCMTPVRPDKLQRCQ